MDFNIGTIEDKIKVAENTAIEQDGSIKRLKSAFAAFLRGIRGNRPQIEETSFKAIGNGLWEASFTNNFLDRENEILTRKSHIGYVDRVQRGLVPMPELWFYHIPGTRHGKALWVDLVQVDETSPVTVIAIGEFDDTPAGRAAESHYLKAGSKAYKLSHGFFAPAWAKHEVDGKKLIDVYNTFEITTLPSEYKAEANLFTSFEIQETGKMMTPEIMDDIRSRFGDDMLKQYEAFQEAKKNELKSIQEIGAEFKDFVETIAPVAVQEGEPEGEKKPPVESQLLSDVLATTNEIMEQQATISQAMQGMMQAFQALQQSQQSVIADVEKRMKVFADFMSQTPSGVDDSPAIEDGEDGLLEAQKNMQERLEKSQSNSDKFWGFQTSSNGSRT